MTHETTAHSAFGGRLIADDRGARWIDGTPEPRACVVTRGQLGPSYRVSGGSVQVPVADCTDAHPSADLAWCASYPRQRGGYTEGGRPVRLVPLDEWDRWAAEPGGFKWLVEHEASILAHAQRLGWEDDGRRSTVGPSGHTL